MVDTIKFSEFLDGGDLANNEITVGLNTGANTKFNNPWTFLAPGTTGDRPAPVSAIYYRLRFNTTLQVYEYYDPTTLTWTQLSGTGTGTVNPGSANDLAFYAVSGQIISPINGANSSVLVTDSSGLPSLSTTLPTGLSIPGAIITASTAALLSGSIVAAPVAGTDLVNKTYVDAQVGGTVLSITGTANQVIASSPTGNVTLSLPQNISTGSTPTFLGLTLTTTPLNATSGGTNQSTYTLGDMLYSSAANTLSKLAGNTTAVKLFLSQTGTGAVSAAPIWSAIAGTDITGAALTKTDDTNVTLTLGGTPTTALLRAVSLTLGWTGTLSGARGGTGVNNGASTITIGGSFAMSGAFAFTGTLTNTTNVTFPTSGTLATTAQIPSGAALTKTDDTNVTLTLGGSPTTALVNAASLTLGWTGQLAIARGGTNRSTLPTTAVASSYAAWDVNSNLYANNLLESFTTTASAAGTTTLTVASTYIQEITGSTTQTIQMPVASTLVTGFSFKIINNSSGNVTLTSSGANTILVMAGNTTAFITCVLASGTTAASWNSSYVFDNGAGVLSITGTANQVIASASTGAVTLSLPQDIGTSSAVQFTSVRLSSAGLLDANNNTILNLNGVASAVNYPQIANNIAGQGVFYGAGGSDANIGIFIQPKAAGIVSVLTTAPTLPFQIYNGTGNQHLTTFNFSNTNAIRAITFPDASGTVNLNAANPLNFSGRITLTTNVPVTTADVTAATTIYFTPYKGNQLSIYNGTTWDTITFTQASLSVPASTSQMYDLFGQNSSGSLVLVAVAWTNDTTRATGLSLQNGVYCETGTLTNLYLGSFRTTTVSGQTEDSIAKRYIWNYYNRVARPMQVLPATASWTYGTATYRQANATATNQLDAIVGIAEDEISMQVQIQMATSTTPGTALIGIGIDSTTVNSAKVFNSFTGSITQYSLGTAFYRAIPTIGRHFYPWLEKSYVGGTTTWYCTADAVANVVAAGMIGTVLG